MEPTHTINVLADALASSHDFLMKLHSKAESLLDANGGSIPDRAIHAFVTTLSPSSEARAGDGGYPGQVAHRNALDSIIKRGDLSEILPLGATIVGSLLGMLSKCVCECTDESWMGMGQEEYQLHHACPLHKYYTEDPEPLNPLDALTEITEAWGPILGSIMSMLRAAPESCMAGCIAYAARFTMGCRQLPFRPDPDEEVYKKPFGRRCERPPCQICQMRHKIGIEDDDYADGNLFDGEYDQFRGDVARLALSEGALLALWSSIRVAFPDIGGRSRLPPGPPPPYALPVAAQWVITGMSPEVLRNVRTRIVQGA